MSTGGETNLIRSYSSVALIVNGCRQPLMMLHCFSTTCTAVTTLASYGSH